MATHERDSSLAEKMIALGDLSALTSIEMPQKQILAIFASKLHSLFGADALAIWSVNMQDHTLSLLYGHDLSREMNECCLQPVPLDLLPDVKLSIEGGTVWTTEDVSDAPVFGSPETQRLMSSMQVRSVIAVPLRALTRVLGAMCIYYKQPHEFATDDRALAIAVNNSLALSLNNVEAYERLVVSEQVKSEVVDIVAHQFRTPIATLLGNVELLQDKKISSQPGAQEQIVEELHKVGIKLRGFVDNFLNVKAIDEGHLEPQPKDLDLNEMIQTTLTDLETFRQQHEKTISWKPLGEAAMIHVDPTLIGEALMNVFNNAIKYAKKDIAISLTKDGKELVIAVKDDGLGIPAAEQSMIFQKLFRASNVAHHPEASSGLGLYICKKYIELNHGRIWFVSKENEGSTFYVAFPAI